jgi:hypothetical protein
MIAATMAAITLKIIALLETLFACSELAGNRKCFFLKGVASGGIPAFQLYLVPVQNTVRLSAMSRH